MTFVLGEKPRAGTKTAVLPWRCQVPPIAGLSVGIGDAGLSGSEKTTLISAAPLTPVVPSSGVTDTTCSGPLAAGLESLAGPPPAACAGLDFCR